MARRQARTERLSERTVLSRADYNVRQSLTNLATRHVQLCAPFPGEISKTELVDLILQADAVRACREAFSYQPSHYSPTLTFEFGNYVSCTIHQWEELHMLPVAQSYVRPISPTSRLGIWFEEVQEIQRKWGEVATAWDFFRVHSTPGALHSSWPAAIKFIPIDWWQSSKAYAKIRRSDPPPPVELLRSSIDTFAELNMAEASHEPVKSKQTICLQFNFSQHTFTFGSKHLLACSEGRPCDAFFISQAPFTENE